MDEKLTPDALAGRLMEVFAQVGILYRQVYRKIEQDTLPAGISVGIRSVLDLLGEHGPMTVPQMGRTQALSRQFVQRMVNEAAAAELVEIRPNPKHQRSPLIALTPKGRSAITAVTDRELGVLRGVGGDLTDADIDTCLKVLQHLREPFATVEMDRTPGPVDD
ncbi:MarR family winged helix-turn-helix transcriptional regulator [Nocardia asteroides]|uniref:MarR family winged helix-turn-helix transcriptional regulator n=1 Tax=Nocardia asteroides TaxID=1824 RepID=UPI001E39FEC6|nr:MarR family winged helix-turn-helix transcriptional regulator [Nocardia asteroides]UGT54765.1 MarR family winged helix-turn-helix transcriptional regulator [Nocardia asteroides]